MTDYLNRHGDSGVRAYHLSAGAIDVMFKDGWVYTYTDDSAGSRNVERMHDLAAQGHGLNSFINKYVRKRYLRKQYH